MTEIASGVDLLVDKGTSYVTINVNYGGNVWCIMKVHGAYNYINVRKVTNNPFRGLGKHFEDFDAAIAGYKDERMKSALRAAQDALKDY